MPSPTINYLYRYFCKTCEDFELHKRIFSDETTNELFSHCIFDEEKNPVFICTSCNTQYTRTLLSEVSDEKIEAQRKRYREYKANEFAELTKFMTRQDNSLLTDLFREPSNKFETKIIESDAGLKAIQEAERLEEKRIRQEKYAEQQKFKNVGRNDTCLCNSGKKYKKCCHSKHQ